MAQVVELLLRKYKTLGSILTQSKPRSVSCIGRNMVSIGCTQGPRLPKATHSLVMICEAHFQVMN
jgi:hypothetical protein